MENRHDEPESGVSQPGEIGNKILSSIRDHCDALMAQRKVYNPAVAGFDDEGDCVWQSETPFEGLLRNNTYWAARRALQSTIALASTKAAEVGARMSWGILVNFCAGIPARYKDSQLQDAPPNAKPRPMVMITLVHPATGRTWIQQRSCFMEHGPKELGWTSEWEPVQFAQEEPTVIEEGPAAMRLAVAKLMNSIMRNHDDEDDK